MNKDNKAMSTTLEFFGKTFEIVMSVNELDILFKNREQGVPVHIAQKANTIMRECGCECHIPGINVRHIGPCCQLVYTKNFTELLKDGFVK